MPFRHEVDDSTKFMVSQHRSDQEVSEDKWPEVIDPEMRLEAVFGSLEWAVLLVGPSDGQRVNDDEYALFQRSL